MTCTEIRDALLTAERAELRGDGEGAVAEHIRSCAGCARQAAALERQTEMLARLVATRPTTQVIARDGWSRRRIAGWTLLPLAAAAALALFMRRTEPIAPARDTARVVAANGVVVEAGPQQKATIIRTNDPKITIVWLSPRGTE